MWECCNYFEKLCKCLEMQNLTFDFFMKSLSIFFIGLIISFVCLSANAQQIWTLKACMDTAFKKNILLNQEQLNSKISNVNLSQSKAAVLPNLNLNDVHSFNSGYSVDPYSYQYSNQTFTLNNLSLNSSVTVFNGFLLLNTVKQNKLIYEAGMLDVEKTRNDIMLNVVAAYMQVLMDYEAIDVAQEQVDATKTQLEQTQKFVDFGKVAELSLLQIQSQLALDKLTKVNAENQLQLDKLTLLQLMETPVNKGFDIQRQDLKQLFPEIPMTTNDIDKVSENFLPQIKSATIKTDAALFSLKMAESGILPKLTLGGFLKTGYSSLKSNITNNISYQPTTIGYLNNNLNDPVIGLEPVSSITKTNDPLSDQLKNNFSQVVNLTLSVPIFNNLQVKSSIAIAKINVLIAKLNEQQIHNDLRKSIETAYTSDVSAGKKLVAVEEQMDLEQRTYHDMEKKYTFGALSATDFLIEKNNFNKVSMSLIQAKYDYVLKAKIIDFYLGKPLIF